MPTSNRSAASAEPRHDWSLEELRALHDLSFPELLYQAQTVHRSHHDPRKVQLCTLLSIKTGACPEDCSYCSQSARYKTGLEVEKLMDLEAVLEAARSAKAHGSTRFCMGAAWRQVKPGKDFDRVLEMVEGVDALGLEVCCTLGMLDEEQAKRLAKAGLKAYNHNLDTGPEFYDQVITTRTYQDRLDTVANVRKAGVTVCCGGILGLGESIDDRLGMLQVLATMDPHPESVPINALVPVAGTPLGDRQGPSTAPTVDPIAMVRMIATARIVLPLSRVRLSAGRTAMSAETQALCFLAGANSIFAGEKLLTTPNPGEDHDRQLLDRLGLEPETAQATPARSASTPVRLDRVGANPRLSGEANRTVETMQAAD